MPGSTSSPSRDGEHEQMSAGFVDGLAKITSTMAHDLPIRTVVDVALRHMEKELGARFAYLHRADEKKRELELLGCRDVPLSLVGAIARPSFDSPLVASRAASTRTHQRLTSIDDLAPGPSFSREVLSRTGCRSMDALALVARQRLAGVLTLGFEGRSTLLEQHAVAVEMATELLALAIEDAGINETMQHLSSILEAFTQTTTVLARELELCLIEPMLPAARAARLAAFIDNAPHAVMFVEAGTEQLMANRRAIQLIGQDPLHAVSEYRGLFRTLDGTTLPPTEWPFRRVLRGEPFETQEVRLRRPDGREVWVIVGAAPVRRSNGERAGVLVVYDDVGSLRDQLRLREEWASGVTHELRQPLNLIMGYSSLLRRMAKSPDPRRLQDLTRKMQYAAGRLSGLVADLTDMASLEAGQLRIEPRPADLRAIAYGVVASQKSLNPDRAIRFLPGEGDALVQVEPARIEQVLNNLLENAIEHSSADTSVDVEVGTTPREVQVLVTNRGPTVPAEELPRLFDRYYRTAAAREAGTPGLGLSLYLVKGLVNGHGGRVWAESAAGETTFHVAIPAMSAATPRGDGPALPRPADGG
jgi:PAS domain S-box-containing protein